MTSGILSQLIVESFLGSSFDNSFSLERSDESEILRKESAIVSRMAPWRSTVSGREGIFLVFVIQDKCRCKDHFLPSGELSGCEDILHIPS